MLYLISALIMVAYLIGSYMGYRIKESIIRERLAQEIEQERLNRCKTAILREKIGDITLI